MRFQSLAVRACDDLVRLTAVCGKGDVESARDLLRETDAPFAAAAVDLGRYEIAP